MRSNEIFAWIEQIAAASGKEKEAVLRRALQSDNQGKLKGVLKLALDPQITFGIIPDAELSGVGNLEFDDLLIWGPMGVFEQLATRQITGNAAGVAVTAILKKATPQSGKLFIRILNKDLRCGLGASTVNKVIPGLLSEFNVMLAAPYDSKKLKFPCRIEPKFDGMRVIARYGNADWQFFTRSGKPVMTIPEGLIGELDALRESIFQFLHADTEFKQGIVFDGELMGETFQETMQQARRKDSTFETARFHVFDWLPGLTFDKLKGEFKSTRPYGERRVALAAAFKNGDPFTHLKLPTSYLVNSEAEIQEYYRNARARGLEGLIIKSITGLYHPKRHVDWMKVKAEETADLPIVDVKEGTGKYVGMLGAFVVDHKGVLVEVGGGYTDKEREEFWKQWHAERHMLEGQMIEVEYQEETPDGSLRHPRYVRLRTDKAGLF